MRGRKPAPTEEKLAKGETRPSRVNYEIPETPAPDSSDPPKDLKGAGLTLWLQLAKPLIASGHLRGPDMSLFLQHCKLASEIESWEKELRKRGLDRKDKLSIDRHLEQKKTRYGRECAALGIDPTSRSKVRTVSKAPVAKPKHDRFFKKGKVVDINDGRDKTNTPAS